MKKIFAMIAIAGIMSGCGDRDASNTAASPKEAVTVAQTPVEGATYAGLKDTDILITVDGAAITKGDLENNIALRLLLHGNRRKNSMSEQEKARLELTFRSQAPAGLVHKAILEGYSSKSGLKPTDEAMRFFRDKAFKMYRKSSQKTYEDLKASLPPALQGILDSQIAMEALLSAVRDDEFAKRPMEISQETIDQRIGNIQKYNEIALATNALVFARATNVWEQILAGGDFTALAEKYTEDEDGKGEGGEWGLFELGQLTDDAEVVKLLREMKPGDISMPIEGDNGLMIMKLENVTDTEPPRYEISRIFFQLPEIFDIPAAEEMMAEEIKEYKTKILEERVRDLVIKAKIEYPYGKAILDEQLNPPSKNGQEVER